MQAGYVNAFVSDLPASVAFFRDTLGLSPRMADESFGYASFDGGPIAFALAQTDDASLVGRHTGVGFIVADIDASYAAMAERGVEFNMPPTRQPWGGTLAQFFDPDGNVFYLDPGD